MPDRTVAVIGAALDLGQSRRGVDMGPSAIRYAGLELQDERARYLPQVKATCARVAHLVEQAVREGATPLVLGGDHSVALGTLGGQARLLGTGGVLWIDAHADLNLPESSPSGNVHGMVLAAVLGLCGPEFESDAWTLPAVEPARTALVGVRAVDPGERDVLREHGSGSTR